MTGVSNVKEVIGIFLQKDPESYSYHYIIVRYLIFYTLILFYSLMDYG